MWLHALRAGRCPLVTWTAHRVAEAAEQRFAAILIEVVGGSLVIIGGEPTIDAIIRNQYGREFVVGITVISIGFAFVVGGFLWSSLQPKLWPNFSLVWLYHKYGNPHPVASLGVVVGIGAILGGALFGFGWRLLGRLQSTTTAVEQKTPVRAQTVPPPPPIIARYQLYPGLPIQVPANTTLYVLQLFPAKGPQMPWFYQQGNSRDKPIFWPEEKMKPEQAAGFVTRCEVTNLGRSAVINLTLDFTVQFSREIQDPNHPKQTTSGPVVAKGIRRAMISLLQPNVPFTFYIVNQSPFYVDVTPPTTATLQMLGDPTARSVALVQPQASVEDLFALHQSFFPSRYPWTGLPDMAIKP